MISIRSSRRWKARRGMALPIVLVVVVMLSLAGYAFAELMFSEHHAADAAGRNLQVRYLCDSGIAKIMRLLRLDHLTLQERGGLYNNPAEFQAVVVVNDMQPERLGRYSVVAPQWEPGAAAQMRFGLEDESAKLNLALALSGTTSNVGQREQLMKLPGMTEEAADSILDWIDDDDTAREFGAETSYYSTMVPPYTPKNAVPANVEELLLVRGVTPSLLFGLDLNRNGFADPHETAGMLPEGAEADGSFDRGWAGMLTVHSAESNLSLSGEPKVNLNGSDLEKLYEDLTQRMPDLATFVIAYRQNGAYTGSAKSNGTPPPPPDFAKKASYKFKSVLDVVGATTSVVSNGNTIVVASPITNDPLRLGSLLPDLLDTLTTVADTTIKGRINVNQAPAAVLLTVPGLTEEMVDQILSMRSPEPNEQVAGSEQPTWLLSSAIVTLDQMKSLLPYLTCRGGVYRAQIIGSFAAGGPVSRVEVLFDATSTQPRQLLWRDLTHLGPGFPRETLGPSMSPTATLPP